MLKFYNYDVVFQEIPDEVTIAVNITNCPNHCDGCHSPHLWNDVGTELDEESTDIIIRHYSPNITCFCFMGGDREPESVNQLAKFIRKEFPELKIGWYSGRESIPESIDLSNFDYVKLGKYDKSKGSLKENTTNQRLYKIGNDKNLEDITSRFWKHL